MSGERFEFLWWQITFVSIAIGSPPVMIVSLIGRRRGMVLERRCGE